MGCADTTITPTTILTQTYYVTDAASPFTFVDWSSSVTGCGSFTYSATLSDGSALPSYIGFTPATKTFSVSTSDPLDINTYMIKVIGTLAAGATSSTTF